MMLLLLSALAFAEPEEYSKVLYKKETEIDFEGIELEGNILKPHGTFINQRKGTAFNPLIELRLDFKIEMSQSISDIK